MKTSAPVRSALLLLLATGVFISRTTVAQPGLGRAPASPSSGMDAALFNLFGDVKAFSAKAEMNMAAPQAISMIMDFALRDARMRTEVDMTKMKGAAMPAEAMAAMKQMGMDRMVSVMDSGQKSVRLIYPGLKAYTDMAIPKEQAAALGQKSKTEKTALGKETIDGHPCVKNQVTITAEDGTKQEAIVWNASDLKDFPVQLEMTQGGNKTTLRFQDIKLTAPDASLFATPAGFTKHESMQALMQAAMMRMLGGQN